MCKWKANLKSDALPKKFLFSTERVNFRIFLNDAIALSYVGLH